MDSKYCIIVPCYEKHALKLESTIKALRPFEYDIFVIDDGSSELYADIIKNLCHQYQINYLSNPVNLGKGGAIKNGLLSTWELGYGHAVQIDSDGQHNTNDLKKFLAASRKEPEILFSGRPEYDESIPKGRYYSRYLTHVWVWIETLSFEIKDSMCGMRVYPLNSVCDLLKRHKIGNRMDFDIEVLVKYFWMGGQIKFIPTKVIYPENGVSYFNLVQDNWMITKMHTKLVFGMLWRWPKLLYRKIATTRDWFDYKEKGSVGLIKLTFFLYRVLGKQFSKITIALISFYYYLFSPKARKASNDYSQIYREYCDVEKLPVKKMTALTHIYNFAITILEKLAVWNNDIKVELINSEDRAKLHAIMNEKSGAFFISSHYGNIEITRALGRTWKDVNYNALIFTQNSQKFMRVLKSINEDSMKNVVFVESFTPETAMLLDNKIKNKEWIFCMGDRVTSGGAKVVKGNLLKRSVVLPQGPFLLSYLLDAPVYSYHSYREAGQFRIKLENITPKIEKKRANREIYVKEVADSYLKSLEGLILNDPGQWYNFYKYWV